MLTRSVSCLVPLLLASAVHAQEQGPDAGLPMLDRECKVDADCRLIHPTLAPCLPLCRPPEFPVNSAGHRQYLKLRETVSDEGCQRARCATADRICLPACGARQCVARCADSAEHVLEGLLSLPNVRKCAALMKEDATPFRVTMEIGKKRKLRVIDVVGLDPPGKVAGCLKSALDGQRGGGTKVGRVFEIVTLRRDPQNKAP